MPSIILRRHAFAAVLLACTGFPVAAGGLDLSLPPIAASSKPAPLFGPPILRESLPAGIRKTEENKAPRRERWQDILRERCDGPPGICTMRAAAGVYGMVNEEREFARRARCIGALAPDDCERLR